MIRRIRDEGIDNSKVMEIAFQLTDVSGPRLTNSPGYMRAASWVKTTLREWGLAGANLEETGDTEEGWELQRSYIAMTSPYYRPLIGVPKAWVNGTDGLQTADLLIVDANDLEELSKFKGRLKGKLLILPVINSYVPEFYPNAFRYTDQQLKAMAGYRRDDPRPAGPGNGLQHGHSSRAKMQAMVIDKLKTLAQAEGAIALLSTGTKGRDGTLFVAGSTSQMTNVRHKFPDIRLAHEDYMQLYRLAQAGQKVQLEVDVKTKFFSDDQQGYNVVAEIKGTDEKLKEEIVMIGGHLDSWHSSTGATDNAAGCAVMMEVVRILKKLEVKPRRTIRIVLWSGEEQGLKGSKKYINKHFVDTATKKLTKEGNNVSAYFNLDNGTGKVRGIYAQANGKAKPIFEKWFEPFKDLGASTVTLLSTFATDHVSFDRIGLPGFQFIQDPIEYDTRTHHSNMDSYDHLLADDLKQAATIITSIVYHAAQRDEKIPRK